MAQQCHDLLRNWLPKSVAGGCYPDDLRPGSQNAVSELNVLHT